MASATPRASARSTTGSASARYRSSRGGEGAGLRGDAPYKKARKDGGARGTKKNAQICYRYKNHAKVDAGSKLAGDLR